MWTITLDFKHSLPGKMRFSNDYKKFSPNGENFSNCILLRGSPLAFQAAIQKETNILPEKWGAWASSSFWRRDSILTMHCWIFQRISNFEAICSATGILIVTLVTSQFCLFTASNFHLFYSFISAKEPPRYPLPIWLLIQSKDVICLGQTFCCAAFQFAMRLPVQLADIACIVFRFRHSVNWCLPPHSKYFGFCVQ